MKPIRIIKAIFISGLIGLILQGCSVTNPYNKDFSCPQKENGKCVGVDYAYWYSVQQEKKETKKINNIEKDIRKIEKNIKKQNKEGKAEKIENYYPSLESKDSDINNDDLTPEKLYYAEQYFNKLTRILKEPRTPVMAMPNVARILILPYQEDKGRNLYFSRYVYVILDNPKWILDNLLFDFEKDGSN